MYASIAYMGYHISILRTEAGQPRAITRDDVLRALSPMAGRLDVMPDRQELRLHQRASGEASGILVHNDKTGELWANNPDEPLLASMIELAGYLDARVRGDEFETYLSPDDTYLHPDDEKAYRALHASRRRGHGLPPVARGMLIRFAIVVIGTLAGVGGLLFHRYLVSHH
jgi:hypothetical protein